LVPTRPVEKEASTYNLIWRIITSLASGRKGLLIHDRHIDEVKRSPEATSSSSMEVRIRGIIINVDVHPGKLNDSHKRL